MFLYISYSVHTNSTMSNKLLGSNQCRLWLLPRRGVPAIPRLFLELQQAVQVIPPQLCEVQGHKAHLATLDSTDRSSRSRARAGPDRGDGRSLRGGDWFDVVTALDVGFLIVVTVAVRKHNSRKGSSQWSPRMGWASNTKSKGVGYSHVAIASTGLISCSHSAV